MDWFSFIIGILVLFLGIPMGDYLARITKEELKDGRKWFKIIILFSIIGTIFGLFLRNDVLIFTFLFIIIVTSRSFIQEKK